MSVQELHQFMEVLRDWVMNPRAWLLQANPVWGSTETVNRIAIFDTKEGAEAYIEASKLQKTDDPETNRTDDGYARTFRPDSLLWDYNPRAYEAPMVIPAVPWIYYGEILENPPPPQGPAPVIQNYRTDHPRYGQDYDVGLGGPYTGMNHRTPDRPPALPE